MFNNLKKLKLGEILQDSKNFIQVNKKTLSIIAASAVVVAGTYYLYKKKGKISSQKQKNIKDEERQSTDVSDDSGFILEEDSKSSFSNLDCLKCSHYDIILNFNSDANIIQTSVKYSFVVQKETNEILLDMDQQEIIICVLDGFSKKFEIKELSREQEDGDKLGVRDINYEAQNSQRQLRIEIERQLEVGERFELTINSITRQIIHPSVKLINNSAEPQNKIFVSTGKGNYSIFPCQNYPSAIATFDITISTKQPQILQKENKKQNAQYKGITSGQYIASYQYSNENYTIFRCQSKTKLHRFQIVIGNIEEIKINQQVSVFQIKDQHDINTIQNRFKIINDNPNLYEKLNALNYEYTKPTQYFILPLEIGEYQKNSLEPMKFIPSQHLINNSKQFKELVLQGLAISQIYDHLNFANSTLQKVNKEILAYFVKLGIEQICNQSQNEQKKHVFEQINEETNFFNKIQKKFDKEQIEQCLIQYLSKTCLCKQSEEEIQNNEQFEKQIYKKLKKTKHISFKNIGN